MYGMIPSANTENRSSPPPENKFIQPNKVPEICDSRSANACPSIPGVGTATPIRYTASIAAVNKRRRRNSGMREAFANPSSIQFCRILNYFRRSAPRIDFIARALRKRLSANRQCERQVAIAQHLDLLSSFDQPPVSEHRRINRRAFTENGEAAQVDRSVLFTSRGIFLQSCETTLRQASLQRHLSTLVSGRRVAA